MSYKVFTRSNCLSNDASQDTQYHAGCDDAITSWGELAHKYPKRVTCLQDDEYDIGDRYRLVFAEGEVSGPMISELPQEFPRDDPLNIVSELLG